MLSRRHAIRGATASLVLAIAAAGGPADAAAPDARLVLDFAFQGQQSPFLLAVEAGHFAKAGVTVQVDRGYGSADAIAKVASGAYDMAFADIGALIQFNAKQGAIKAISVFQVYDVAPMCVFARAQAGIRAPRDLAGRRIAAPPGSASRVIFPVFAKANGIALEGISWVDVTPQLRETLLAHGQVDATTALITDLPGVRRLGIADADLVVLHYKDYGVDIYGHALVTTPSFAADHADRVRAVVSGAAAALKATIADPARAIAALKARDPLTDPVMERERLDLVIRDSIATERVRRDGLGAVDPARLARTIAAIAEGFGVAPLDPAALYRPDYLPPPEARRLGPP
jgi:NitT/TauT family transport system substrate-binding protein